MEADIVDTKLLRAQEPKLLHEGRASAPSGPKGGHDAHWGDQGPGSIVPGALSRPLAYGGQIEAGLIGFGKAEAILPVAIEDRLG